MIKTTLAKAISYCTNRYFSPHKHSTKRAVPIPHNLLTNNPQQQRCVYTEDVIEAAIKSRSPLAAAISCCPPLALPDVFLL